MRIFVVLVAFMIVLLQLVTAQRKLVCYYGSWSTYRPGNGKFDVENLNASLCTHAIYSFIGVNTDATVKILDSWNDISLGAIKRFNNLRLSNPNLKTLVAIGGWNEGSTTFSSVCANTALRAKFVDNLYNFVKQHGFNGLDLDWEYPAQRGGIAADKVNFVSLIKELRAKFTPDNLILSAAVSANIPSTTSYNVIELANNLDFINLMTYDYHGSWELVTGENSPLYAASIDANKYLNVDATVKYWLQQGAPAFKLVLGMPLYGRTWTLKSATSMSLGAGAIGPGAKGPYTQESGFLGYNEICEMQKAGGWITKWEPQQQVPYTYKNTLWVGYDNIDSIKIKTQYVNNQKLAGAMVWSVETDDFRNICGAGNFPLLNAIKSTLA